MALFIIELKKFGRTHEPTKMHLAIFVTLTNDLASRFLLYVYMYENHIFKIHVIYKKYGETICLITLKYMKTSK